MEPLFDLTNYGGAPTPTAERAPRPPSHDQIVHGDAWSGIAVNHPGVFHRIVSRSSTGWVAACGRTVARSTINPSTPRPGCAKCGR
jgi:hypothetical protein